MKRLLLALALCPLFTSVSFGQQNSSDAPATKADIERYLDAMHTRDRMKNMMDAMTAQIHKMNHEEMKKNPNLPPDAEDRLNKLTDDLAKNLPIDELLDAMIPVYEKHLTKGDVDALVAFYSSPTGQKMIKEQAAMVSEGMQAAYGVVQKMTGKMMDRAQAEIAQMQKENADPKKQPPTTQN